MATYLVQLQVKKPNGKVHLLSMVREATTPQEAFGAMSAGSGDIIGGFVTCDPYKVAQWIVNADKEILRGYPNMKGH
jgi:hypothetical protein